MLSSVPLNFLERKLRVVEHRSCADLHSLTEDYPSVPVLRGPRWPLHRLSIRRSHLVGGQWLLVHEFFRADAWWNSFAPWRTAEQTRYGLPPPRFCRNLPNPHDVGWRFSMCSALIVHFDKARSELLYGQILPQLIATSYIGHVVVGIGPHIPQPSFVEKVTFVWLVSKSFTVRFSLVQYVKTQCEQQESHR